jgi:predicted Zn-dependent peptidase
MSVTVHKSTLPSGLMVVTVETPHLHSAVCSVFVRVGSRHEDERTNGVSHLLEHLFFRGSRRYPDSVRMNAAVEAVGGNLNGVTMRDSSSFFTPVHPDGVELALHVLGDMLTRPRLVQLEIEKRIILEEMLDEVDERGRDIDVDNLSRRALYAGHPLAMKIAGTPDTVRGLTLADVKRHFARAYVAGNLVVGVAGPVTHRQVARWVAQAFRHLPPGPRLDEVPPAPPPPRGPRVVWVERPEPQVEFRLAFPTVPEGHPDAMALSLLRRVLDDGLSSRLPHIVVERKGLAYSIGALIESLHDAGSFEIDGACAPPNLAPVLRETFRILGTLRAVHVSAEELHRAQARHAMHLDFLADSPGDLISWFGGIELWRPAETFAQRKAEARAVTRADLGRVARRWITPDRAVFVAVGPRSARGPARQILSAAAKFLGA